ncbi:hypothetical protein LQK89_02610 [Curtobacterium sp. C1]|uniref:hypothetical protein n=1 Tax=Curtobacterium sp. C1 TaxID=2898151 RepID=UPI001E5A3856|nr:hypothetical protein [Curtobacterium sp. C1]UFU14610.1 hypothetical protein LQK89_02610 [Curtobacterium sp. C1]
MTKNSTRLADHELASEGAPYRPGTRRGQHTRARDLGTYTVAGTGYALCSCGAHSDVLTSGRQRKAWHREHKASVLLTRQAEER